MTSKQKKRLAILLSIVAGVVLVASVLVVVRLEMLKAGERAQRQEGLELVQQGEYADALKPLGKYIHRNERDVEALNAFIEARLAAETASGGHLSQAMAALRMLVRADPDDTEARLKLLELYDRVGFSSEALDLIGRLDAETAQRPEVLRYRLRALMRLREYDDVLRAANAILEGESPAEKRAIALLHKARALIAMQRAGEALDATLELTELRPADYEAHALAVELLWSQRGEDAALEHAAATVEAHAGDPAFEMLLSLVHAQRNEQTEAREFATQAASRPIEDTQLALRLSQHLERLRLYQTSLAVLEKALEANSDQYVLRWQLAWQYFSAGRFDEALKVLEGLDPEDPAVPAKLLIYRGMTLIRADRGEEANRWIDALQEHRTGDLVEVWIPVLEMVQDLRIDSPVDALRLVRDALNVDDDPLLHATLGRIRESQGENELAIAAYRDAASRAPAWPEPLENLAALLLKTDRSRAALSVAQRLLELAGKRPSVLVTVIDIAAANRDRITSSQRDRLIDVGLQAWQSSPGVPALTVSLMELLAASERAEEAVVLAESAVSRPDGYTPRQLARMAVAAESLDLDAADTFRQAVEQTQHGTPEGALGQALMLHRNGQTREGWALLEEKLEQTADAQREQVLLGMAIYRESTGMNGAADIYRRLLDETDNRPEVARRIVNSSAAAEDPELLQQAIDILWEFSGEGGLEWRVGQARFLLRHGEPPRSVNRAIALLDEVIASAPMNRTARLLLADAHRLTGNTTAAVEQIMQAAEISPEPTELRLTAAALLIEQGEVTRGLATLRNAAESLELTPEQTRRVALLYQIGRAHV
jgi:tetratricopeptide (TPR) repeat protein